MKKFVAMILSFSLLLSLLSIPVGATSDSYVGETEGSTGEADKVYLEELQHAGNQIIAMEEELNQAGKAVEKKYEEQINALVQRTTTSEEISPEIDSIKQAIQKERTEAEKTILEKYGFASHSPSNESNKASEESPLRSPATNITFSETPVTYDKNTKIYRYTVDWTFPKQDSLWDTYDVAGVGMTNSSQYTIYKSFAKTFTNFGTESCYVDDKGNSHPVKPIYDDCISKRAETQKNGVLYNIKDGPIPNVCMPAESGRITVYVIKNNGVTGTPTNKIIASYAHNWKQHSLEPQAKIQIAGFKITGALLLTYERVNKSWDRASGGKVFPS